MPGKPLLQKDPDSLRSPDPQHYTTGAWPACSAGTVSAVSGGRVNWNTAPRGSFADAHNRPPCASMIERQIDSPMPRPPGLVVKRLEQALHPLRVEPRAGIAHADAHGARSIRLGAADQCVPCPVTEAGHRFDGVDDQVQDYLLQLHPIALMSGRPSASRVRTETPCLTASPWSSARTSRIASLIARVLFCGGALPMRPRIRLMTSPARLASLTIRSRVCRTSSPAAGRRARRSAAWALAGCRGDRPVRPHGRSRR